MKPWLLPMLMTVALVTYNVAASYVVEVLTIPFEVTEGLEDIEAVGCEEIEPGKFKCPMDVKPGDTETITVKITNIADNPQPTEIDAFVIPAEGILVVDPGMVEVPADALAHEYEVSVTADTDIPTGTFELTIEVRRE